MLVYSERRFWMSPFVRGMTRLVVRAGGHRYVRVTIDPRLIGDTAIALLGHELQHVAEIAAASTASDDEGCVLLFRRIGYSSCAGYRCFETLAAQGAERRISEQLRRAVRHRAH